MRNHLYPCPILVREESNIRKMHYESGQLTARLFSGKPIDIPHIRIESTGGDILTLDTPMFNQLVKLHKIW